MFSSGARRNTQSLLVKHVRLEMYLSLLSLLCLKQQIMHTLTPDRSANMLQFMKVHKRVCRAEFEAELSSDVQTLIHAPRKISRIEANLTSCPNRAFPASRDGPKRFIPSTSVVITAAVQCHDHREMTHFRIRF